MPVCGSGALLLMISPASRATACPLSGRNSTYCPVQISELALTSLSATPHLWSSVQEALANSRYLILLLSPEAAASKWVDREVSYWLAHNSIDTLLIGITTGELFWDELLKDFADGELNSLPPALKGGRFPSEPKWVDLRTYRESMTRRD